MATPSEQTFRHPGRPRLSQTKGRPEIKVWPSDTELATLDRLHAERGIQRKPYLQALMAPALALEARGIDAVAVLAQRLTEATSAAAGDDL